MIDQDAYYASLEQRDDPTLRGRPVAVGGSRERGVVAAASYEARRFGVRSAMPAKQALRLCPELIFVPPRFDVYRAVSQTIRSIFLEYTPLVEPVALDEAYLDVTSNLKGIASATQIATEIRTAILETTGLTASAGISYNRFLAKLASEHNKPNGQFTITPAMGPDFVADLDIARFHGIGPATATKMNALGIRTGRDLRDRDVVFLQQHFGKAGPYFHAIAHGIDNRPIEPNRPRRSSGSETTFQKDLSDPGEVEAAVARLADEVWAWSEKTGVLGRTVTLKLRWSDFQTVTRSRSTATPIQSGSALASVVLDLVRSFYPLQRRVRLLGVTLSGFNETSDTEQKQGALDFGM